MTLIFIFFQFGYACVRPGETNLVYQDIAHVRCCYHLRVQEPYTLVLQKEVPVLILGVCGSEPWPSGLVFVLVLLLVNFLHIGFAGI